MKKVGFLVFEDANNDFLEDIADKLRLVLKDSGWDLVLLNQKLEGIPKKELLRILAGLKNDS